MQHIRDRNRLRRMSLRSALSARRRGFTLVEVAAASAVLAIAAGGLLSAIVASMALNRVNNETGLAHAYAQRAIERIKGVRFEEVFATFNTNAADDPLGAGTGFGANFEAFGLDPLATDLDGRPGEIIFPTVGVGGAQQLREDVDDPALGMPRDLNGDGLPPDTLDHAADYRLLPIRVRVQWRGVTGERSVVVETLLTSR
jgi:prepilin-type N-terminal cleavage/methylation domain-containing protein